MSRACGHFSDTRLRVNGQKVFAHATDLFQKASPSKWSNITIHDGDRVETVLSGGGGWGPPHEREPESVLSDVVNGFVSLTGAKDHYGVVIEPREMTIDHEATTILRERMRNHQVTFDLNPRIKVILSTILNTGAQSKAELDKITKMEGVTFAQNRPEGFLIKLEGRSLQELFSRASTLREKLNALESLPLTMQFVPSDFQTP
jgi:hypothetical protein